MKIPRTVVRKEAESDASGDSNWANHLPQYVEYDGLTIGFRRGSMIFPLESPVP